MKLLYYLLPLFGVVSVASELATETSDKCQCPQVKCPGNDPVALCNCLNGRETLCKKRCPKYEPTYLPCPAKPSPTNTYIPSPTSRPQTCECPLVNCLAIWPGGCHCVNTAAQNCYDKCGGEPPKLQDCGIDPSLPQPTEAEPTCECEGIMCIQAFPESCYCANAAAQSCYAKCGGPKPNLQSCPAQSTSTLTTKTKAPTATPTLLPPNTHKVCGGGRANDLQCDEGYACITDPYTPGCGPACDALGICVKDKMCGGFGGFACEDQKQVCHDDPRDDCNRHAGGADCAGLCVTPHRSLTSSLE
ncbi:hypothetical protein DE146DRAFT_436800 [Phaeosphaeria sp. MPI-PUGE-AT-0046c]|nr:hypothetical protein DE146DRAFT_436800 [Phaeosphaeria sp. MPI-PUGE-AT-0046c]